MVDLQKARKSLEKYIAEPVVSLLIKTHLTPNAVTCLGLLITIAGAVLIALNHPFVAGFIVFFAGFFDMLDGTLARMTNRVTRFGGVLDSTLDRLSEAAVLIGVTVLFAKESSVWGVAIAGSALISSQLVSYIRAKAEALNIKCEVGVFTRPERVIILTLGLLLSRFDYVLMIAVSLIALLSFITAGQRLFVIWRETRVN
jgi:CDP-diacylglycerol--glycerol-3-phosphate 3-phosphatidyltransferase